MTTTSLASQGSAFSRRRVIRTASGVASAGLMVGVTLAGASPATAATDADCTVGNTVDANAAIPGTQADIQALLSDPGEPLVCLDGTFVLTSTLTFNHTLTIHGLTDAVLDGDDAFAVLLDDGNNTLTVENLRITQGLSAGAGAGAIGSVGGYPESSTVIVRNSQLDNNNGARGGAIWAGDVIIEDSLLVDNVATDSGGAAAAEKLVSATRSTFRGNSASYGGAIWSYDVVTADASTFESNEAERRGGAINANGDGATRDSNIQNSTFVNNSTTHATAATGGALYAKGGTVRQSTFLDNSDASNRGQSISAGNRQIEIRGNIFAGSSALPHLGRYGGDSIDGGANLFTTAEVDETELTSVQASTQFDLTTLAIFNGATLADNGGPTQTIALHSGSPAIRAVSADPSSMTVDQRGTARPAVSDAGAFEFDNGDADGSGSAGSGDGAELAATGTETAGWLTGVAALLFAAGLAVVGFARRRLRSIR